MIPESYYVDVNINYKKTTPLVGSVPMSVLVSTTAKSTKEYTTLQQVQSDYTDSTAPELLAATIYFNNGGTDLLVYQQTSGTSDADTLNALLASYDNFIWVTFVEEKTVSEITTIASTLSSAETQLPKFLAQTSNVANAPTTLNASGITNVALLYSTEDTLTPYSAIVIPAYFSGVDTTETNSIVSMVHTVVSGVSLCDVTTTQLDNLYAGNWNVVVNLGGRYTTFDGGKMVDGQPIHSAWGFAIFKKDCEDAVTDLLVSKLPYDNSSNAVIENALSGICNQFVTNGLIGTDKVYNETTETTSYNGVTYTLIRNGQVLNNGYYIYSISIANAISADKEAGKIPPIYIYVIINDVIRQVEIIGEVTK